MVVLKEDMELVCCTCSVAGAKYSCPSCDVKYCSVACFKTHKAGCSVERSKPLPEKRARVDLEQDESQLELEVLSEAHLAALCEDKRIISSLKSSELQETIRIIDGSRTRLDALEAALHNIPEFRSFVNHILEVVAKVPPE